MVFAAVVAARMCLLLVGFVVGLDAVYGLRRQALLQQGVVGKHFFAVHQDAHGLVHPIELAVFFRHARQLLDEFVETGPFAQVEGFGVKHHRVAAHHKPLGPCRHHGCAQEHL